jgi:hypothetical protein
MTVEQLQAGYNRFTKDYYRMMEIVYRAFSSPTPCHDYQACRECWPQDEQPVWTSREGMPLI